MVDPATMPEMVSPKAAGETKEERKIELSEIIGLPDFDVSERGSRSSCVRSRGCHGRRS